MNIKHKLKNFSKLNKEIEQLNERILDLRHKLYSIKSSSDMSLMPASGGNSDKLTNIIVTITELEDLYMEKLNKLLDEQKEIEKLIERLEPVERILIRARYIECEPWESICRIIGYGRTQTYELHAHILKKCNEVRDLIWSK